MGFVERGPAPGRRRAAPAARSALAGRASATPARASVQTESPRVQLLALRSPDRAAHSPERRLPRVRRVLYLVGAIVFVDTMFFAALTPLLPQYAAEFGIGKTGWGLLQAAYPAGALMGAIPSGMVAARAGVKPTVIVGLCCIALTSTAFGFADSVWQLDLARFAQGLASSFSWTGALAWLVAAAPPARRGALIGTAFGLAIGGALCGPILGGIASIAGTGRTFTAVAVIALLILPWPSNRYVLAFVVVCAGISFGTFWTPAMSILSDAAEEQELDYGYGMALINLAWAPGQAAGAAAGGRVAAATADAVPYLTLSGLCALTLAALWRSRSSS